MVVLARVTVALVAETVGVLAVLHRIGSELAVGISMIRGLLCSRAVGRPSALRAPGCSLHCKSCAPFCCWWWFYPRKA